MLRFMGLQSWTRLSNRTELNIKHLVFRGKPQLRGETLHGKLVVHLPV